MKDADSKSKLANRLSRIEGQVRGVSRMVEEDRYCIDILTQVQAVRAALARGGDRAAEGPWTTASKAPSSAATPRNSGARPVS